MLGSISWLIDTLMVFTVCSTKSNGKLTSLDQYISRMKSGQKDIFYITGTSKEQLEKSPFLERLSKKNFEVSFPLGISLVTKYLIATDVSLSLYVSKVFYLVRLNPTCGTGHFLHRPRG